MKNLFDFLIANILQIFKITNVCIKNDEYLTYFNRKRVH